MAISITEDLADFEEHDHAGNAIPPRVSDDGRTWWCPVEDEGRALHARDREDTPTTRRGSTRSRG